MKVYNVRIGLQYGNIGAVVKSFTSKSEAITFYNQYHPNIAKEWQEDSNVPFYLANAIVKVANSELLP